jgi:hypothetical protein
MAKRKVVDVKPKRVRSPWRAPSMTVKRVGSHEQSLLHDLRGTPPPPFSRVFYVEANLGKLGTPSVASVAWVEGPGVALFSHLVTNPGLPPRVRHAGVRFLLRAVQAYATVTGKVVICVASPSVARFLARRGGTAHSVGVLVQVKGEL